MISLFYTMEKLFPLCGVEKALIFLTFRNNLQNTRNFNHLLHYLNPTSFKI